MTSNGVDIVGTCAVTASTLPPQVNGHRLGSLIFELWSVKLKMGHDRDNDNESDIDMNTYQRGRYKQNGYYGKNMHCRVQFWGDDSFIDIPLTEHNGNSRSTSGNSVVIDNDDAADVAAAATMRDDCRRSSSNSRFSPSTMLSNPICTATPSTLTSTSINTVEYPIVGSIVGLKHYFQDMNILPLLILQKNDTCKSFECVSTPICCTSTARLSDKNTAMTVMGCGNLDLDSMLNQLMESLHHKSTHTEGNRNSNNLSAINGCIHLKVPIISTTNKCTNAVGDSTTCSGNDIAIPLEMEDTVLCELDMKITLQISNHNQHHNHINAHKSLAQMKLNDNKNYNKDHNTNTSIKTKHIPETKIIQTNYYGCRVPRSVDGSYDTISQPLQYIVGRRTSMYGNIATFDQSKEDIVKQQTKPESTNKELSSDNRRHHILNEFGIYDTSSFSTITTTAMGDDEDDSILLDAMFDPIADNNSTKRAHLSQFTDKHQQQWECKKRQRLDVDNNVLDSLHLEDFINEEEGNDLHNDRNSYKSGDGLIATLLNKSKNDSSHSSPSHQVLNNSQISHSEREDKYKNESNSNDKSVHSYSISVGKFQEPNENEAITSNHNKDLKSTVHTQPVWMRIEFNHMHLERSKATSQISQNEMISIQIKIRVSCSLGIVSLQDLELSRYCNKTPQSSAFKEEIYSTFLTMKNEEERENFECKDVKFCWDIPLKVDAMQKIHQSNTSTRESHFVKVESWICFHDQRISKEKFEETFHLPSSDFVCLGASIIPISFKKSSVISNSLSPLVIINGPIKFVSNDNKEQATTSALIFVGSMKNIKDLPVMSLAATTLQRWWTKKIKPSSIQIRSDGIYDTSIQYSVLYKGLINDVAVNDEKKSSSYQEQTSLIQREWQKWRKTDIDETKASIVSDAETKFPKAIKEISKKNITAENMLLPEDGICCVGMKKIKIEKESSSKIRNGLTLEKKDTCMLKEEGLDTKTSNVFVRIGRISGIREIILLWRDNEMLQTEEFHPHHNQHELILAGIIITFQVLTKTTSLDYAHTFCSSKVLSLNQLNQQQTFDFKTVFAIDQSKEMLEYIATETFDCFLWFVPVVTESMAKQYPTSNHDDFSLPEGSRKVCHARCPLIAVASLSTITTYTCPWSVSLTKDSEEVEMMGAIDVSFGHESSKTKVASSLVNLCHNIERDAVDINSTIMGWESLVEREVEKRGSIDEQDHDTDFDTNGSEIVHSSDVVTQYADKQELSKKDIVEVKAYRHEHHEIQIDSTEIVSKKIDQNVIISNNFALHGNFDDDLSHRSLSSVMESLDAVTAEVKRHLVGIKSLTELEAKTPVKTQLTSPNTMLENYIDIEPQAHFNETSSCLSMSNKQQKMTELEQNSQVSKDLVNSTYHQNLSSVLETLNQVTEELHHNGIRNSISEARSTRQEQNQSENKETRKKTLVAEAKNHDYQRHLRDENMIKISLNSPAENRVDIFPIFPAFVPEKRDINVDVNKSCDSSVSLVLTNTKESRCNNWDEDSFNSSSSGSDIAMSTSQEIMILNHPGTKLNCEEKYYTESDDSSSELLFDREKEFRTRHGGLDSSVGSSSSESFENEKNLCHSPQKGRKRINNERIARIMGVCDQKNCSEDETELTFTS